LGDLKVIAGFHHTGIVVQDLAKMVRFYTEDLGLKLLLELESNAPPDGDHTGILAARRKLVFVGFDSGHQIELVHYLQPPAHQGHLDKHQLGCMHVCFSVDDVQSLYSTLSAKGVRFATTPKYRRATDQQRIGVVYAQDPEGNWLEFVQWNVADESPPA
jgi:extradiol dioxygenase family protein